MMVGSAMMIWVDADACPQAVKDVAIKAALRLKISIVFVANKALALPVSDLIASVVVPMGPDVADAYIIEHASKNDLVISQDIPLAAALVPREVVVIDPRGTLFDQDNIGDRLSVRDLMTSLRDSGAVTGGPAPFGEKEKRQFASTFDRELTRLSRLK